MARTCSTRIVANEIEHSIHRYLRISTIRRRLREVVKILKRLRRINCARTARHLDGDGKDFDKFLSTRAMFLGGRGMIDNAIVATFGDRDRHCSQFFDFGGYFAWSSRGVGQAFEGRHRLPLRFEQSGKARIDGIQLFLDADHGGCSFRV